MNMLDWLVTVIIPAIIGIIIAFLIYVKKFAKETPSGAGDNTSAPALYPFRNPITFSLLVMCIGLISLGAIIAFEGDWWSIPIGFTGTLFWWAGYTKLKTDPVEAGAIRFWGRHISIGGKSVVVGGDTILADYFPFNLGVTTFDTTNVERQFKMSVLSKNGVTMTGFISLTGRPKLDDAIDYIRAGKIEAVYDQLETIVYEAAKRAARAANSDEIAADSEKVSGPLRQDLAKHLDTKSFGVDIFKCQGAFDLPSKIIDAKNDIVLEMYQQETEMAEYNTQVLAAKALFESYEKAGNPVKFGECLEQIKSLRLIRDGKVIRIDTDSKVGNIVFADAQLFAGGNNPEQKRKDKK